MKLISWNVNGIRAALGKGFAESFAALDAEGINSFRMRIGRDHLMMLP